MTIRNVYYEITSFHTLMVADTHVSKGKRENTERLRFYDNREGNLEEISTLLRAGKLYLLTTGPKWCSGQYTTC